MIFITVTCLFRAIVIQRLFGGACQRRRSQAHPRLLPEGYRATSPRALAGGHRPKRSVASIAHFAQWVDTRGCLRKFERRGYAERAPHPYFSLRVKSDLSPQACRGSPTGSF